MYTSGMIYLRNIPDEELFGAQLELLMQQGRFAALGANVLGVFAMLVALWPYFSTRELSIWVAGMLVLLLARSAHMSRALASRTFRDRPVRLFWQLILGSALTGAVWSSTYVFISPALPTTLQYTMLLIIVMISAVSLALMVVVREYFFAFLITALWPIAWWSLVHPWDQPHNLTVGLLLLAMTGLLFLASNGIHQTFRRTLSLSWQQEAMARELGQIAGSLRDRNRQLQDARRKLTDLANIDELTGLGNRRLVNRALREEINRARRTQSWLSIILIDVDYFKNYNDTYGHTAGDDVLRRVAAVLERAAGRAGELATRYGGEEFLLILPGVDPAEARRTAQRLRRLVHQENIPHSASSVADRITISQGTQSLIPQDDLDPGIFIDRADAALYDAKRKGRDLVVAA